MAPVNIVLTGAMISPAQLMADRNLSHRPWRQVGGPKLHVAGLSSAHRQMETRTNWPVACKPLQTWRGAAPPNSKSDR